jgi:hypothetical protein
MNEQAKEGKDRRNGGWVEKRPFKMENENRKQINGATKVKEKKAQ